MSEYTQSNLKIFGVNKDEYRRELLKHIPIERLRTQFGGKLHDWNVNYMHTIVC